MRNPTYLYLTLLAAASLPVHATSSSSDFDTTTLSAPDGSINATFVAFGSTLTSLWVRTKDHTAVDVVPGYDDPSRLRTDEGHPVLISTAFCLFRASVLISLYNPLVGRYANRLKNGTFSIPITKYPQPDAPNVYHTPLNDHNGEDTLHGGIHGWDRRSWTLVRASPTSVTYRHIDTADEGFPGTVTVVATHTVSDGGVLLTTVHATATEKTPIMLTQHIYWNLDGFEYGSDDILGHELHIPGGAHVIEVDGDAVPTGALIPVAGTHFDYRDARRIGAAFEADPHFVGYDNAWIYGDGSGGGHTALWSRLSGVRLDITTDQPAVQVYTASLNMPRKGVHGGPAKQYGERSTVAIEQEGWLDAINTPEWGVNQIYDPGREFRWNTKYQFSVLS
ncbi:galactose mutarotase-like protein [Mycena belliarum]|uniref:Galactose mutarotase-like protein n=1 Tax=Mycena belliarum TaxID=1033014 RepID=A0AAD6UI97_9AGAR|nr:galactose mutarotase-like protein [Mycena belliae]